jgi:predicted transcriptional regulator
MVKTTLYLDEESALRVRQVATAQGRSQADVVREAIAEYTAKQEPQSAPYGVGQYESKSVDSAAHAKALVRERIRTARRL